MNRKDNRTTKQFAKDIKECTKIERTLMTMYVDWLNSKVTDENKYTFVDNGVDNSGKYIAKDHKVTMDADFLLLRKGRPAYKIEIKFCRTENKNFHLKTSQLEYYIQNNVAVVNFMDVDGANPRFCILKPDDLAQWMEHGEKIEFKPWGYKECVRFPVKSEHLTWHKVVVPK